MKALIIFTTIVAFWVHEEKVHHGTWESSKYRLEISNVENEFKIVFSGRKFFTDEGELYFKGIFPMLRNIFCKKNLFLINISLILIVH